METVGAKLWCFFPRQPEELFKIITKDTAYRMELVKWVKRLPSEEVDPDGQCSRGVCQSKEDCTVNSQQQSNGRLQRKTTFAWLVPFVQSILDYSDTTKCPCILNVIDFLHGILGKGE